MIFTNLVMQKFSLEDLMYSYQHKYHAGNFADLHKHITLIAILRYLQKKTSPYCVIDGFAGDGLYDLNSSEAQRNQEYLSGYGVAKTLAQPQEDNLYQELLNQVNEHLYPGSPTVIKNLLRPQDKAIFIENHPQAHQALLDNIPQQDNIRIFKKDCYEIINSVINFPEPRGVVLLDPSYEVKTEYSKIGQLVAHLHERKPNCIYIVWYPILADNFLYKKLLTELNTINNEKTWHHQLKNSQNNIGLIGSGLVVINMPWSVDTILEQHFNQITID